MLSYLLCIGGGLSTVVILVQRITLQKPGEHAVRASEGQAKIKSLSMNTTHNVGIITRAF